MANVYFLCQSLFLAIFPVAYFPLNSKMFSNKTILFTILLQLLAALLGLRPVSIAVALGPRGRSGL